MKYTATAAAMAAFSGIAAAKGTFGTLQFNNGANDKAIFRGRVDPIVSPGEVAQHVHGVMGGSNFGPNTDGKKMAESKCTNAKVKEDLSSYWFPWLYFRDPQTQKLEPVDMYYSVVYYFFEDTDDEIKAFPQGLQIVGGNASTRVVPEAGGALQLDPEAGPISAAQFTCTQSDPENQPWEADSDGSNAGVGDPINKQAGTGFPSQHCNGLYSPLRADIHMPSCYNPEAGLTNHKENMAYPNHVGGKRNCPEGYIHVPHLFYETYWDTGAFEDRWGGEGQPFVYSNGDVTGFSAHADFLAAWDEDVLQNLIDNCNAEHAGLHTCAGVTVNEEHDTCGCENEGPIEEVISGILDVLPGDRPLEGWSFGVGNGGGNDNSDSDGGLGDLLPGGGDDDDNSEEEGDNEETDDNQDGGDDYVPPEPLPSVEAPAPIPEPGHEDENTDEHFEIPEEHYEVPEEDHQEPAIPGLEEINHNAEQDDAEGVEPVFTSDAAKPTSCPPPNVKTVWETETVHATATQVLDGAEQKMRRHIHDHARRHHRF